MPHLSCVSLHHDVSTDCISVTQTLDHLAGKPGRSWRASLVPQRQTLTQAKQLRHLMCAEHAGCLLQRVERRRSRGLLSIVLGARWQRQTCRLPGYSYLSKNMPHPGSGSGRHKRLVEMTFSSSVSASAT